MTFLVRGVTVFVTVLLLTMGLFVVGVYQHETVHVVVADTYGCDSTIHPQPRQAGQEIWAMWTTIRCPGDSEVDTLQQHHAHQTVVEIVGYHVIPLYGLAGLIVALQLLILHRAR